MDRGSVGTGGLPGRGRWRDDSGFTLLELLIVASIVVVISSIGMVQVTSGLAEFRIQESARTIEAKLMEARLNALKRNRPVWLAIDTGDGTMTVQMTDAGGNTVDLSPEASLRQGVSFASAPAQVSYDALGRLPSAQTITVDDGNLSRTVTVLVTGTTRVN